MNEAGQCDGQQSVLFSAVLVPVLFRWHHLLGWAISYLYTEAAEGSPVAVGDDGLARSVALWRMWTNPKRLQSKLITWLSAAVLQWRDWIDTWRGISRKYIGGDGMTAGQDTCVCVSGGGGKGHLKHGIYFRSLNIVIRPISVAVRSKA
jgi:hypothetical protein